MNPLKAAIRYWKFRASWLGDGGQPVTQEHAEKRSAICATCTLNNPDRANWEALTAAVSGELRVKADMHCHVSNEDKIHICDGCDCYLPLKVWSPLKHVLDNTDLTPLPPHCWIQKEANNKP